MASVVSTMEYLPKNLGPDLEGDRSSKDAVFDTASSNSASVTSGSGI